MQFTYEGDNNKDSIVSFMVIDAMRLIHLKERNKDFFIYFLSEIPLNPPKNQKSPNGQKWKVTSST